MSGTFADSNRADVRAIPEVTWGVTPTSGTSKQIRYTSHSLAPTKDTRASDEIRSDRMVSNNVETSFNSGGDLNFELSAGGQDDWMEGFLAGTWSRPMEMFKFIGNVSWGTTSRLDVVSVTDQSSLFIVGRRIKVDGFVNPANNGYFQIQSVTYTGGVIQVTVTTTSSVVESATVASRVYDANDVVILRNTSIRMGTAAASTIDSNATNAFASAIAAGQLRIGQRIFIDGNGLESGTIVWSTTGANGDSFSINDGSKIRTFVAGTDYVTGATATITATNVAAAINNARVRGDVNVRATSATGTVTIVNLNVTGGAIAEIIDAGSAFAVTNFANGNNSARGFFTITSLASDVIGVFPAPPTVAAGTAVTIKACMLRNPGDVSAIVNRSWTLETHFTDVSRQFSTDGQRVGGLSLTFTAGEIVTGSVSFQGRDYSRINTRRLALAPYTTILSGNTEVVNATSNVGTITKNGVVLSSAVKEITLTGESNLRPQTAITSKFPRGMGIGRLNITGSLNVYFNTIELFDHFKAHDTVSVGFNVSDLDSNTYFYTLPAVKFSSDNIVPEGIDQDVMETIEFMAQRDPSTECMMQIDRFSATSAV